MSGKNANNVCTERADMRRLWVGQTHTQKKFVQQK